MSIHFGSGDWDRVRRAHTAWWNGELDRPLLLCTLRPFAPDRPEPRTALLSQANCHDFSISPEDIIDAEDYILSQREFLGDSFPAMNLHSFGPGVVAAFCGARLDNSSGRVWFFPEEKQPIEKISIHYHPESPWVERIKSIYRAGQRRWQGNVLMGMPDLGGVMDIVASFVGSEELLYALIDEPEEVHRLCEEAREAWWAAYSDFAAVLEECGNPGYSDWDGLLSETPSYVLQSDFSYMISPAMFREFVLPDLAGDCERLTNAIYHQDGVGQLNHLADLLSIESLKAIQWQPGDGQPKGRHWLEVYRRIADAHKGIEIIGSNEEFLDVFPELPAGRLFFRPSLRTHEEVRDFLDKLGVSGSRYAVAR